MQSPTGPSENPGYKTKRKGVRRPRWRNGYVEEWCPGRGRYVYQHRLVMERRLGRRLLRSEVIHHRNGIKTDNRDENLEYHEGHSSHAAAHHAEGTWGAPGVPRPSRQKPRIACPICGTMFKPRRRTLPDGSRQDVGTCSFSCGQRLRYRR